MICGPYHVLDIWDCSARQKAEEKTLARGLNTQDGKLMTLVHNMEAHRLHSEGQGSSICLACIINKVLSSIELTTMYFLCRLRVSRNARQLSLSKIMSSKKGEREWEG